MNVFHKRPLGLILCVILGGFSLFSALNPLLKGILLVFSIAFILVSFALKPLSVNKTVRVASISLFATFLMSILYFEVAFYPTSLFGEECYVNAVVTDCTVHSSTHQTLFLKTKEKKYAPAKFLLIISL